MRKLLLATVAALGASMGVATVADAQTAAAPAPGTITVRLNGRFRFYSALVFDRDSENNITPAGNVGTGTNKNATYAFGNYARLYPGFDGVAANGLKYGASLEIRQDNGGAGAGGGTIGSISGRSNTRNALYFRKAWGYLGTDTLGTIRLGSTDGPLSLYMVGNFENFNDGGINGDYPGFLTPATSMPWPFADVGNLNTGNKAMYLSPQFFGFDFGVSFEPNTGNGNVGSNCVTPVNGAGVGCDRLASTPVNGETSRRRNTFEGLVRYRGSFGPVGIAATAGYVGSSHITDNSGLPFGVTPGAYRPNYDGLSVGDFGVAVTFGGFSVGGKYQFGRFNNQWDLAPKGAPDGEAWLVGASYTAGPIVVGAHYLDYKSAGNVLNALAGRERREQGLAAGATYSLAPGVSIFLSYLYEQRRQNGFDFVTGTGASVSATGAIVPNTTPGLRNRTTAQVFGIGTGFSW